MQQIRDWYNNGRDYFLGVVLLESHGGDPVLCAKLAQGENPITRKRLEKEMAELLESETPKPHPYSLPSEGRVRERSIENPDLYAAAKLEADKAYRENQNKRALLFSMAEPTLTDINHPDEVRKRAGLAIAVVLGNRKASELYDKARFIQEHGRLPTTDIAAEKPNYHLVPEDRLQPLIKNHQKAISKLKKREPTPERVALIQEHENEIKQLKKAKGVREKA